MKPLYAVILAVSLITNGVLIFGDTQGQGEAFPSEQCVYNPEGNLIMCAKAYDDNRTVNEEFQAVINESRSVTG